MLVPLFGVSVSQQSVYALPNSNKNYYIYLFTNVKSLIAAYLADQDKKANPIQTHTGP